MNNIKAIKIDDKTSTKLQKKARGFIGSFIRLIFLISIGYIVLFPLFNMLSNSIKTVTGYYDATVYWLPRELTFGWYEKALEFFDLQNTFFSTFSIQILSGLIEVMTCAFVAYGFARFKFPLKRLCEVILLATILVPIQVYILPVMLNFRYFDVFGILGLLEGLTGATLRLNLLNTGWTFWLPSVLAVGLRAGIMIYIYIPFFKGLPKELEEAASIDGATSIQTYFRVILPSSTVVLFTVLVFSVIWHWNDYQVSVMYFNDNYPMALQLSELPNNATIGVSIMEMTAVKTGVTAAACLIFILPLLIFYIFVQRKFVASIDRVGITG